MGTSRIRLKMLPVLLSLAVAIVSATNRHHHRGHHPTVVDGYGSPMAGQDVGYSECSGSYCPKFEQEIIRMKRQAAPPPAAAPAAPAPAAAPGAASAAPGSAPAAPGSAPAAPGSAPAVNGTVPAAPGTAAAVPGVDPAGSAVAPVAGANSPAAANDTKTSQKNSTNSADDIPLPPPVQFYPNMPKNFPYPTLDAVQQPPVPTRARKQPRIQSPYPAAPQPPVAPMPVGSPQAALQSPLPAQTTQQQAPDLGTPFEPPIDAKINAGDSVSLPDMGEAPEVLDLSEFNVPGTNDAVVQKPIVKEAPVANVVPQKQQRPVASPTAAGPQRGRAPEDWRYSEQPKRRCKTALKQTCRNEHTASQVGQPMVGPAMTGPPMGGQPMAASPMAGQPMARPPMSAQPMTAPPRGHRPPSTGCRPQQVQPMAPAQPASSPSGTDPWKSAEQMTVADINHRDEATPPEGETADSAGERTTLAIAAIVLAQGLFILF